MKNKPILRSKFSSIFEITPAARRRENVRNFEFKRGFFFDFCYPEMETFNFNHF